MVEDFEEDTDIEGYVASRDEITRPMRLRRSTFHEEETTHVDGIIDTVIHDTRVPWTPYP
jgi:hypothetical protein